MTTFPPPVPNPAETVRRPTRILSAFMSHAVASNFAGRTIDPPAFISAWQTYLGRVAVLPPTPAPPRIQPLSPKGQQHAAAIQKIPAFQGIYGVQAQFTLVELGKLVAFQWNVDMDHAAGVHGVNLAQAPGEDEVLNQCLPPSIVSPARAQWDMTPRGGGPPGVMISTTDLTFDIAPGFPVVDYANGQVIVRVASGANLMLVRRHNNDLVLANGYHRAYTLRSRGVEWAPVVIVDVQRREDLIPPNFLDPQIVFGSRRPIVDDFLDDTLSMTVEAKALMKVVRMTFESLLVPRMV